MKKRKVLYVLLLSAMLGVISGCGAKESEPTLRVAYFPNITHTQALIMKEKGMLEQALGDWKIEWYDFNSGTSEMEAVFAEEIDIGYIGPVPAISGNVKSNGDVKIIAGAANGGSMLVARADSNITGVASLSGKTVAVPSIGNTQHLLLCDMMTALQLKSKASGGDVDVKAVANGDTITLMESGAIDAALVPEPWGSTLVDQVGAKIVMDYDDIWREDEPGGSKPGEYATTCVIARNDFIEEKPEIVKLFLEQHKAATEYIAEKKEEACRIVNKQIQEITGKELNTKILKSAFERIVLTVEIPKKSILKYQEAEKAEGMINRLANEQDLFGE